MQVLADDFGFETAIATLDSATAEAALANHDDRINANLALLTDVSGRLAASTHHNIATNNLFPFVDA